MFGGPSVENKYSSLGISQWNTNISLWNKNNLLCDHLRWSIVSRVQQFSKRKSKSIKMNELRQVLCIKWQKLFWELRNQCSDMMMAPLHLAIFQEMASEWQSPLEQQHCSLIMFCPCFSTLIPQSSYKGTKSNLCRTLHGEKSYSRIIRCFLYINICWSSVSMDWFRTNTYKAPQPLTLVKGLYVSFSHQKGEEKFALFSQLYNSF